jgi:hypothetical protein
VSTAASRPFLAVLRAVERELTVPLPERVRVLRELEYDLEALRDRLVDGGLSPELAETRALEALVPDGDTLRALGRVHAPLYARFTRGVGGARLRLAERSVLAAATAAVLVVGTLALLRVGVLGDPSLFLWPVLVQGALLFGAIFAKAFGLWIKRDHSAPGRGLGLILGLSASTLTSAVVGAFVDFYRVTATLAHTPELAAGLLLPMVVRTSTLLAVAMLFALAGGLTWFVLTQWTAAAEGARRAALGLDTRTS